MRRKSLIALALFAVFGLAGAASAQGLGNLRSWAGKYPTERKGRVTRSFFRVPAVQRPLSATLSRKDLNLLTSTYQVETPIKELGDYLAVKVCMPHNCDTEQAGIAINLRTGNVYVRMQEGTTVRWFASKGDYTDLPRSVQDYLNDFAAT
jgi:cytochrome c-type biogenesis protein CcmH/NrfF